MLKDKLRLYFKKGLTSCYVEVLCCLIFNFLPSSFNSQTPDVRHFDNNNGMPGAEVYGSYLDKNGFIWFFGDAGLSKYNGFSFKQFSVSNGLPDNTIFELIEDKKGRIWTRTFSGKVAYIEHDSVVDLPCNTYLTEIISGSTITSIVIDDKDVVWLGLNQNSKVIQINPPYKKENIKTINFNTDGRYIVKIGNDLLVANASKEYTKLRFFDKQKTQNIISFNDNFPQKNPETRFLKLSPTKFLIGINNNILVIENNTLIKQFTVPNLVVSISFANHKYWIGLYRGGIYNIDENFTTITQNHLFKGFTVSKVTEDKEGGLWVTNIEKGTYYYPDNRIMVYNSNNGLVDPEEISCSFKNKNLFLVATKTGNFYKYEHLLFKDINPLRNKNENLVAYNCFAPLFDNALLTCGSNPFIINYNNSKITYKPIKSVNLKKAIYIPKEKLVLFTNTNALNFANPESGDVLYSIRAPQRIHSIAAIDTSTIYLGLAAGLFKYHQGKITQVIFSDHTINERVTAVNLKDNWIIVGTNGWGIKVNNGKETFIYDEKNGLISNIVTCMLLIKDELIVGTNKGLQQFIISDQIKKGHQLGKAEGLPSNEIKYLDYYNDTLYVTTSAGLTRVPLSLFSEETIIPEFNEVNVYAENKLLNEEKVSIISSDNNKLVINYNLAYYKNTGKQLFRYKLSDSERTWIYTSDNTIYFNALPKGEYKLTIEYYHKNKGWIKSSKDYRFIIEGHIWETWWFILGCILIVTFITFLIVSSYYTKRLIKAQLKSDLSNRMANIEMKALRSQMNPHFVFNVLNSIQNFILKQDAITAHRLLGRFAKLIRNILEQSVHDTITIEHEIETLKLYVELECMRMNAGFDYTFEINTQGLEEKIPSMLIQPFIENAIRHGLANKEKDRVLSVSIRDFENESVIFVIKDNGVGRINSAHIKQSSGINRQSFGMQITNERIELVKQLYHKEIKVEILDHMADDNSSLGTEVIISIPYIKPN